MKKIWTLILVLVVVLSWSSVASALDVTPLKAKEYTLTIGETMVFNEERLYDNIAAGEVAVIDKDGDKIHVFVFPGYYTIVDCSGVYLINVKPEVKIANAECDKGYHVKQSAYE